ncbi:MAG: hypothetical protein IEMM0008_0821 [bacterium]|nr:MAG: hypothetical protein IEMM0008_0821 [bacterium]
MKNILLVLMCLSVLSCTGKKKDNVQDKPKEQAKTVDTIKADQSKSNQPKGEEITGVERDKVLKYAEPMTDGILKGFNEGNHKLYSKDFTEQLKNAMTEKVFMQTRLQITSKIGMYKSRSLYKVLKKDQYIYVLYKAVFEKDKEVKTKMIFQDFASKHYVASLWFFSPKLKKQSLETL